MNIWKLKGNIPAIIIKDNKMYLVIDWSPKLRLIHKTVMPFMDRQAHMDHFHDLGEMITNIIKSNQITTNDWERHCPPDPGSKALSKFKYGVK